jgi:excinuclease UvrABC nuclease subunit
MKDLQEQAKNENYGTVIQITKPDYNQQVTDASSYCWVVV